MRIVAGKYRHRLIEYPNDALHIRPTKDRVREAVFSAIGNIDGAIVLDLYAGSGAMGIEALSREAKKAFFVDNNHVAISTVTNNLKSLSINNNDYSIIKKNDFEALEFFKSNDIKFDLVILDPPYKSETYNDVISYLLNNSLLTDNAILIIECNRIIDVSSYNFRKVKDYKYGEITVTIAWR